MKRRVGPGGFRARSPRPAIPTPGGYWSRPPGTTARDTGSAARWPGVKTASHPPYVPALRPATGGCTTAGNGSMPAANAPPSPVSPSPVNSLAGAGAWPPSRETTMSNHPPSGMATLDPGDAERSRRTPQSCGNQPAEDAARGLPDGGRNLGRSGARDVRAPGTRVLAEPSIASAIRHGTDRVVVRRWCSRPSAPLQDRRRSHSSPWDVGRCLR